MEDEEPRRESVAKAACPAEDLRIECRRFVMCMSGIDGREDYGVGMETPCLDEKDTVRADFHQPEISATEQPAGGAVSFRRVSDEEERLVPQRTREYLSRAPRDAKSPGRATPGS